MMVRGTERNAFLTVDMPLFRHKDLAEGREMNENARGKRTEDRNGRCHGRVGAPRRTPRTGRKSKHIIHSIGPSCAGQNESINRWLNIE
jgi:hypothetical protein